MKIKSKAITSVKRRFLQKKKNKIIGGGPRVSSSRLAQATQNNTVSKSKEETKTDQPHMGGL
jgi:hypothetical protein